jgi:hypothetical protein
MTWRNASAQFSSSSGASASGARWTPTATQVESSIEVKFSAVDKLLILVGGTGDGDVFEFDDFVAHPIGAVLSLNPDNIEADGDWIDASSNELNGTATGATPLMVKPQSSGTWTPVLDFFTGSADNVTYSVQQGNWRKLSEKTVLVEGRLTITGLGSDTGSAFIEGLPFTVANRTETTASCSVIAYNMATLTSSPAGQIDNNGTKIALVQHGASGAAALTVSNFQATAIILFSAVYETE